MQARAFARVFVPASRARPDADIPARDDGASVPANRTLPPAHVRRSPLCSARASPRSTASHPAQVSESVPRRRLAPGLSGGVRKTLPSSCAAENASCGLLPQPPRADGSLAHGLRAVDRPPSACTRPASERTGYVYCSSPLPHRHPCTSGNRRCTAFPRYPAGTLRSSQTSERGT